MANNSQDNFFAPPEIPQGPIFEEPKDPYLASGPDHGFTGPEDELLKSDAAKTIEAMQQRGILLIGSGYRGKESLKKRLTDAAKPLAVVGALCLTGFAGYKYLSHEDSEKCVGSSIELDGNNADLCIPKDGVHRLSNGTNGVVAVVEMSHDGYDERTTIGEVLTSASLPAAVSGLALRDSAFFFEQIIVAGSDQGSTACNADLSSLTQLLKGNSDFYQNDNPAGPVRAEEIATATDIQFVSRIELPGNNNDKLIPLVCQVR